MKRIILSLIAILFLSTYFSSVQAQDSTRLDPSLKGQYQLMISKSKTLNGYRMINPDRLSSFWRSVNDTLRTERKQLALSRSKIAGQGQHINTLKTQIAGNENAIASTNAKLNEISFLGINFTKPTYNIIVWTLIILLGLALTITIIRSAKHIHEAKYRSGLYEEISQEYQNHKIKANDKEKKLARELQDERNKLEELKSRGR